MSGKLRLDVLLSVEPWGIGTRAPSHPARCNHLGYHPRTRTTPPCRPSRSNPSILPNKQSRHTPTLRWNTDQVGRQLRPHRRGALRDRPLLQANGPLPSILQTPRGCFVWRDADYLAEFRLVGLQSSFDWLDFSFNKGTDTTHSNTGTQAQNTTHQATQGRSKSQGGPEPHTPRNLKGQGSKGV